MIDEAPATLTSVVDLSRSMCVAGSYTRWHVNGTGNGWLARDQLPLLIETRCRKRCLFFLLIIFCNKTNRKCVILVFYYYYSPTSLLLSKFVLCGTALSNLFFTTTRSLYIWTHHHLHWMRAVQEQNLLLRFFYSFTKSRSPLLRSEPLPRREKCFSSILFCNLFYRNGTELSSTLQKLGLTLVDNKYNSDSDTNIVHGAEAWNLQSKNQTSQRKHTWEKSHKWFTWFGSVPTSTNKFNSRSLSLHSWCLHS